jgi:hypothetical protein
MVQSPNRDQAMMIAIYGGSRIARQAAAMGLSSQQ